jgi:hypothetical protein
MNYGSSMHQQASPFDLLESKFNVSLAGVGPSTTKDMDLQFTKQMPIQQDIEDDAEDDAHDPLKEYYRMMKEKLDEQ